MSLEIVNFLYVCCMVPQVAKETYGLNSDEPVFIDPTQYRQYRRTVGSLILPDPSVLCRVGEVNRPFISGQGVPFYRGEFDRGAEFTHIGQWNAPGWVAIIEPLGEQESIMDAAGMDDRTTILFDTEASVLEDLIEDSPRSYHRAEAVLVKEMVAYCTIRHSADDRRLLMEGRAIMDFGGGLTPFCEYGDYKGAPHEIIERSNKYPEPIIRYKISSNGDVDFLDKFPGIKPDAGNLLMRRSEDPFIR